MTAGRLTLIAAVGRNRAIGRDNEMPWHLPEDLAHFKQSTLGHIIVMGRKTYDSIGRALPGRHTVVVTRQRDWSVEGVDVAGSLEAALDLASGEEVFVAGGGQIYAQALPRADRLLITEVDQSPAAEVFFPEVDQAVWREVAREPRDGFAFVTYERRDPLPRS